MKIGILSLIRRRLGMILCTIFLMVYQLPMGLAHNEDNQEKVFLEQALQEIGRKYRVYFSYDRTLIDNVKVELSIDSYESVDDALTSVMGQTNLFYQIFDQRYVAVYQNTKEGLESLKKMVQHFQKIIDKQEMVNKRRVNLLSPISTFSAKELYEKRLVVNVSGLVMSSEGEPLIGVNVLVKGTDIGTATDFDGKFVLNDVDENAVLLLSYIGYQTLEVPVQGKSNISITLIEDSQTLDEVVVVGYSTKKMGELTGSVSTINGRSVEETSDVNILQAIQGKLPGLVINNRGGEPGNESVQFSIRGLSTLGNNSPLIIIDGVPRESFAQLSPNDIENITILKDASAAIYGARAANGVINIKTKRGKIDGENQLRFSSNYGISTFTRVPEMMDSYKWALYQNEIQSRYGRQPLFSDEQIEKYKGGGELPSYPNTDMYEETFRNWAPEMHHNLSSSGGTEKLQYYLSGDYVNQEGLYKSEDLNYDQYQIRSNIDANIFSSLTVGLDISARLEKSHSPAYSSGSLFSLVQRSQPIEVGYFDNGLPGFAGEQGANPVILSSDKAGWNDQINKVFQSKVSLTWKMDWLTEGLSLITYGSVDYDEKNNESFHNTWTYYTYDVNTNTYVPNVGYDWEVGATRWLELTENRRQNIFYHLRFNYNRSFRDHNFEGFLAYEQEEGQSDFLSAYRKDLISDKKIGLWAGGSNAIDNNSFQNVWGRQNFFGSFSYNFKRKYLVDFTLRYDGSSAFSEEQKFGMFPGVSLGWNMSEEAFFTPIKSWLNNLKLRLSFAKMGNDRIPGFQYLNQFELNSYYVFGVSPSRFEGFVNTNTPNPNITWEESAMANIGWDAIVWDGALAISFDLFQEKRRQILIKRNASVPGYTALLLPDENLGKVDNRGIELKLNHNGRIGEVEYNIGGNLAYNKSKIVYMDEAENISEYRRQEGFPIQSWLVYKTDGIYKNELEIENSPHLPGTLPGDIKYVDLDGDNEITGNDVYRRYTSAVPEIQYGFNFSFKYKRIELSAFLQGQANSETLLLFDDLGNRPLFQFEDRWTEDNLNSKLPRAIDRNDVYNAKDSDFWLYDASFLRLRNLVISYDFPFNKIPKSRINNMRIFLKGSNLLTLDKIKYVDPEVSSSQARYYPQLTKLYIGIELSL